MKNKRKTVGDKIMTVIGAVLCMALLPVLIINCTLIIQSITNKNEAPRIGSIIPMVILTDSMHPVIQSGDLIICQKKDSKAVQVGDIICYFNPVGKGTSTVTHRVKKVITDQNGNLAWVTKGDSNNTEDQEIVPSRNLVGIYQNRIPKIGNAILFMQTTKGLILCVIIPLILLMIYDVIRRKIYEKQDQYNIQALIAELEALRAEKIKKQQ